MMNKLHQTDTGLTLRITVFEGLSLLWVAGLFVLAAWYQPWLALAGLLSGALLIMGIQGMGGPRARRLEVWEAPGLYRVVENLSRQAGLDEVPELRYLPLPLVNAAASEVDGRPVIYVTRGIIQSLDETHLEAVLAHEVSHIWRGDTQALKRSVMIQQMGSAAAVSLGVFWFMGLLDLGLAGLALVTAAALTPWFLAVLASAASRAREYRADLDAAVLGANPLALAETLRLIEFRSLSPLERFMGMRTRPEGEGELLRTHPSTQSRVEKLVRYGVLLGQVAPHREPLITQALRMGA